MVKREDEDEDEDEEVEIVVAMQGIVEGVRAWWLIVINQETISWFQEKY